MSTERNAAVRLRSKLATGQPTLLNPKRLSMHVCVCVSVLTVANLKLRLKILLFACSVRTAACGFRGGNCGSALGVPS